MAEEAAGVVEDLEAEEGGVVGAVVVEAEGDAKNCPLESII